MTKPKKRQLLTSCDESSTSQEENNIVPADSDKTTTGDVNSESNLESESKRLKLDQNCSPPTEKSMQPRQTKCSLLPEDHKAKARKATLPLSGMDWQCVFCTYINNAMLPYCEMCENPQGSAGEY